MRDFLFIGGIVLWGCIGYLLIQAFKFAVVMAITIFFFWLFGWYN